ncbi:hypothetical protein GCM10010168_28970 [Actinoplanes ianthinogenes]|uniref:DUF3558 domain-containing protein n=1 Tax=Actinoplanes ianthinogenes TaxID=122358 RepID=A0ABM7LLB0_9ACTN|nr:hypothetical protein [Actinoplanes ianthinogenes]BCJ40039.1 hypothetical protein Aiant_06960 [Actinoplanes ianthinogenes]GGR09855.1 hypothetical protein GCM10010168_28970 [Actinoplanes ianthinogenes]
MSGRYTAVPVLAVLLLTACADQAARPEAPASAAVSPAPAAPCGLASSTPAGATLRAADVGPAGGVTSSRFVVLTAERCGGVAVQPDRCDTFPWVAENGLYALGGRAWLSVTVGKVREQVVLYAPDSSFAATYEQAAGGCGFANLTVLDGRPVTMQRTGGGSSEVVYMAPGSVIWLSSADPAIGTAELVRLAGVAESRARSLPYPS